MQLQQYDTYSACIEALQERRDRRGEHRRGDPGRFRRAVPGAFKIIGKPFSTERYGIGLRKGDSELRKKINDALEDAARRRLEGRLRPQPRAGRDQRATPPRLLDTGASATVRRRTSQIFGKTAQILRAFWTTIQLTVFAAIGP